MFHKATKANKWERAGIDPSRWELRDGADTIAEVLELPNGEWRWYRHTSIKTHGIPPGSGREPSRREAQRRATSIVT